MKTKSEKFMFLTEVFNNWVLSMLINCSKNNDFVMYYGKLTVARISLHVIPQE